MERYILNYESLQTVFDLAKSVHTTLTNIKAQYDNCIASVVASGDPQGLKGQLQQASEQVSQAVAQVGYLCSFVQNPIVFTGAEVQQVNTCLSQCNTKIHDMTQAGVLTGEVSQNLLGILSAVCAQMTANITLVSQNTDLRGYYVDGKLVEQNEEVKYSPVVSLPVAPAHAKPSMSIAEMAQQMAHKSGVPQQGYTENEVVYGTRAPKLVTPTASGSVTQIDGVFSMQDRQATMPLQGQNAHNQGGVSNGVGVGASVQNAVQGAHSGAQRVSPLSEGSGGGSMGKTEAADGSKGSPLGDKTLTAERAHALLNGAFKSEAVLRLMRAQVDDARISAMMAQDRLRQQKIDELEAVLSACESVVTGELPECWGAACLKD